MTDTITREQLVQATTSAIKLAEARHGCPIPDDIQELCISVAQTVPRVCGQTEWWLPEEECGCLVGWIFSGAPSASLDVDDDEPFHVIGLEFMHALTEVYGHEPFSRPRVLNVVD